MNESTKQPGVVADDHEAASSAPLPGQNHVYEDKDKEITSEPCSPGVEQCHSEEESDHDDTDHDSHAGVEINSQARDLETLSRVSSGPPYSAFSPSLRSWIVAMNTVSAFISPITANIYFPALPAISKDLGVSIGQINLTLTTYQIFQALAPTVFGDFGDIAGRRPAFIIAFTIYLGANIGLALQRNYAALLVLRMLQSGGSSGTIALVYAVVADIALPSERGVYMGIVGTGITVGPAVGPVIGGLLSNYLGWSSIFWFLCIVTVAWLIPYILTVPETGRKVVGNGSIPPPVWNMTLLDYIRFRRQARDRSAAPERQKIPIPNPLNTLKVLRHKDMAMILFYNATLYLGFMLITSTLSSQFSEIYGFNQLQLGLCYLPMGGACTIASVCNGFIADWNYRRIAKNLGIKIDRKRGNDMRNFPIEKCRIQLVAPLIMVGAAAYIGYAWSLQVEAHVAVPLVLSFFVGMCVTGPFQIINLLIVDLYPEAPATATAANNLCRCMAGAIATAVIQDMIDAMGRGWAFTFIGLLIIIFSPSLWVVAKYGPKWRGERVDRMKKATDKKEAVNREKAARMAENSGVVES
ncbi:chloramphenicol resistance protein [Biscogniauxia sp. FL1348]|nr:chloramphenicol resistance protein [Biscogniauxia sp. FL1348]